MNESKAKTQWCPLYTAAAMIADAVSHAETEARQKPIPCQGSDCPMWRRILDNRNQPVGGYCGLGGPEK